VTSPVGRVLGALAVPAAVVDAAGVVVEVNPAFARLCGAALAPGAPFEAILAERPAGWRDAVAEVAAGALMASRLVHDTTGVAEVTVTALPDGGVVLTAVDATERELLRDRVQRNVAELATIFDVLPEAVCVYAVGGAIVRANRQALATPYEGDARSLADLWQRTRPRRLDGATLFLTDHPAARALRGEDVRGAMLQVRRGPAGEHAVLEMAASPLRDDAGQVIGAVSIARDVTEQVRLGQELEEQVRVGESLYAHVATEAERLDRMVQERTRQLLELQGDRERERRLAAIGQLAAGVMHDVNNVLNPIVAAAYLLDHYAHDTALVKEYAGRIATAAETGVSTLARLRRFIRQEPAEDAKEAVDLAVVVRDVVELARALWERRPTARAVTVETALGAGAVVRGYAGELREAVLNLIQNALDAMPDGGTLRVTTRVDESEVVCEVVDDGQGIDAEVLQRVFEPFFTTKGSRGGTGLGLSEVYGVMKRHRGTVELDSVVGHGTTARLRFPLATSLVSGPQPALTARETCHVLVLGPDADEAVRQCAVVAEAGGIARTGAPGDPAAAIAAVPVGEAPDVVLVGGDAAHLVAAARAARRRWPLARVGAILHDERPRDLPDAVDFVLPPPLTPASVRPHLGPPP
jgi:signal transduction histidine kinase